MRAFILRFPALLVLLCLLGGRVGRAQIIRDEPPPPSETDEEDARIPIVERFGIKVGGTLAGISTKPDVLDLSRRAGVNARAYVEWYRLERFLFMFELAYVQRGFSETISRYDERCNAIQAARATSRIDYVSIPLLLRMDIAGKRSILYGLAGPRIDFLVNRKPGTFDFTEDPVQSDLPSFFDSPVAGGTIGLGIEARALAPVSFRIEMRYDFDLTDSLSDEPTTALNNGIDLVMGIAF